ncbi:MAG: DUF445 domain-containing protein, partial [Cruoricaptor ignavus]|nr:DUF445 domain-containing protein [Cruoricaptor ignavus]
TNLIQNKKEQIGDNLGEFVVSNFLSPQNIRPYMLKIKVSHIAGDWLAKEKNQVLILQEMSHIILDIVNKLEDKVVIKFISVKINELTKDVKPNQIAASGLEYILKQNNHQTVVTELSKQIKNYIVINKKLVQERVKKESDWFVPSFVDQSIANKITNGLVKYFDEVEYDENHNLRQEITEKLFHTVAELKENKKWEIELNHIKNTFLTDEKLSQYSADIWQSIKKTLLTELEAETSPLKNYAQKNITQLSQNLQNDEQLQYKIDHWIRVTAYKYILENTHQFGELISSTIGNWEGKELSNKLELEVGKDLQFIRINGTLVGGLVGLIIYTIAHFFI